MAKGYIHNTALTSEKFIPDPFNRNGRLYKSGDLVKLNEKEELLYLKRKDKQIQLRGFRVELGAIESVLSHYRFVDEAKVICKERNGEPYLVAYYVSNQEIEVIHFRRMLSKKLPLYMIPSYFVRLEELKLTANGKLDEQSLPEPTLQMRPAYEAPESLGEKQAASIWSAVLGLEEI